MLPEQSEFIPNYTIFEASNVQIQLFKTPSADEDGPDEYQAALLILLDAATDTLDYNVTIFTDIKNEVPLKAAKLAFLYASVIFNDISPIVSVWLESDEQGEDIDLRNETLVPDGTRVH